MAIVMDFSKISQLYAQRNSSNIFKGCLAAFTANQRRYAAMLTHIGVSGLSHWHYRFNDLPNGKSRLDESRRRNGHWRLSHEAHRYS